MVVPLKFVVSHDSGLLTVAVRLPAPPVTLNVVLILLIVTFETLDPSLPTASLAIGKTFISLNESDIPVKVVSIPNWSSAAAAAVILGLATVSSVFRSHIFTPTDVCNSSTSSSLVPATRKSIANR